MIDAINIPESWGIEQQTNSVSFQFLARDGDKVTTSRDYDSGIWTVTYYPNVRNADVKERQLSSKEDAREVTERVVWASERDGVLAARDAMNPGGGETDG